MLLSDNQIRQCHHGLSYLILQVSLDLISSVPNLNSANKETDIKKEEDPLLITFQDLQEENEVHTYVQLSTFHSIVN
jgi:hypothetical protein